MSKTERKKEHKAIQKAVSRANRKAVHKNRRDIKAELREISTTGYIPEAYEWDSLMNSMGTRAV